jgi:hypothetical protein
MQTSMNKTEIHARYPVARLLHELHGLDRAILSDGLVWKLFVEFWYDKGKEVVEELPVGKVVD